jgi:hypothetical protein
MRSPANGNGSWLGFAGGLIQLGGEALPRHLPEGMRLMNGVSPSKLQFLG